MYSGDARYDDTTIRFMDESSTSNSSNDFPGSFPKSRTLSGFDWKQNNASIQEEEPHSSRDSEFLVKRKRDQGVRTESMTSHEVVVEDGIVEVELSCLKNSEENCENSSKSLHKKRRNFKDTICCGISRLFGDVVALINGQKGDNDGDDVEYGPVRYVPNSLSVLMHTTNFTKEELKTMYRTFKNECPTGVLYEETFTSIYSQFFPEGDAGTYAHYLFNAFDIKREGYICFEDFVVSLSCLLRGEFEDKLECIFKIYDINHDGFITLEEMQDIVKSVYSIQGTSKNGRPHDLSCAEHANRVFQKLDQNNDGYVTYSEFVDACKKDPSIMASMKIFEDIQAE